MAILDPRRRRRTTLILLLLTAITVLTLDFQESGPLASVQRTVRGVLEPIGNAAGSVASPFANAWRGVTDYDDLTEQNAELRAEIDALRGSTLSVQAAEQTLRDLLGEVDIDYLGAAESVIGQVVDRPGNFQSYSIEIDVGSNDEIEVGMPVVTSAGLIGRVVDVAPDFAEVRLINKIDFGIGVRVVGSGDVALARGQGEGEDLLVTEGLGAESGVGVGDVVVTSGIDGSSYPPDLVIGTVSEINVDRALLTQSVRISPSADLENLRFVNVVLWTVEAASSQ